LDVSFTKENSPPVVSPLKAKLDSIEKVINQAKTTENAASLPLQTDFSGQAENVLCQID